LNSFLNICSLPVFPRLIKNRFPPRSKSTIPSATTDCLSYSNFSKLKACSIPVPLSPSKCINTLRSARVRSLPSNPPSPSLRPIRLGSIPTNLIRLPEPYLPCASQSSPLTFFLVQQAAVIHPYLYLYYLQFCHHSSFNQGNSCFKLTSSSSSEYTPPGLTPPLLFYWHSRSYFVLGLDFHSSGMKSLGSTYLLRIWYKPLLISVLTSPSTLRSQNLAKSCRLNFYTHVYSTHRQVLQSNSN